MFPISIPFTQGSTSKSILPRPAKATGSKNKLEKIRKYASWVFGVFIAGIIVAKIYVAYHNDGIDKSMRKQMAEQLAATMEERKRFDGFWSGIMQEWKKKEKRND